MEDIELLLRPLHRLLSPRTLPPPPPVPYSVEGMDRLSGLATGAEDDEHVGSILSRSYLKLGVSDDDENRLTFSVSAISCKTNRTLSFYVREGNK